MRNCFALPPGMSWKNLERVGLERMEVREDGSALVQYISEIWDAGLTWDTIPWLRGLSSLPLVVKGILTAEDAVRAVEQGAAGIVVSNHGGRQLDGTLPTSEALAEVVDAVAGRAEIFVDGGIRRGSDVLKALALGARAVLIGRPYLWRSPPPASQASNTCSSCWPKSSTSTWPSPAAPPSPASTARSCRPRRADVRRSHSHSLMIVR